MFRPFSDISLRGSRWKQQKCEWSVETVRLIIIIIIKDYFRLTSLRSVCSKEQCYELKPCECVLNSWGERERESWRSWCGCWTKPRVQQASKVITDTSSGASEISCIFGSFTCENLRRTLSGLEEKPPLRHEWTLKRSLKPHRRDSSPQIHSFTALFYTVRSIINCGHNKVRESGV